MSGWNPDLYRQFEQQRTRPARDLLEQVQLAAPSLLVDLGCGPGNSSQLLLERYPHASVIGVDNSDAMLVGARARLPQITFVQADIAHWRPDAAPDLIYANAALQWLGDHERLIPRLFALLGPGGVLAFQMPNNRDEPSHRLMRELAASAEWSARIDAAATARVKLLPLQLYYELLRPLAAEVQLWQTTYFHPLPSAGAIVEWVRSTGLRPLLDPLTPAQQAEFLHEYEQRIADAYPRQANGERLLAFPRAFVIAARPLT